MKASSLLLGVLSVAAAIGALALPDFRPPLLIMAGGCLIGAFNEERLF